MTSIKWVGEKAHDYYLCICKVGAGSPSARPGPQRRASLCVCEFSQCSSSVQYFGFDFQVRTAARRLCVNSQCSVFRFVRQAYTPGHLKIGEPCLRAAVYEPEIRSSCCAPAPLRLPSVAFDRAPDRLRMCCRRAKATGHAHEQPVY